MKKVSLKFKSLSLWFLSFVFCFNTSCNNQNNKCMNINKAEKSINNKENKKVDIGLNYQKLMKNYKKEELINNKKFVKVYFRNEQYAKLDCIIQLIAKYLENWNYKLLSLFNENFYNESSQKIHKMNTLDLLKLSEQPKGSRESQIITENNLVKLKEKYYHLVQFFNMGKLYQKTHKIINQPILKDKNEDKYLSRFYIYKIIYLFLQKLSLDLEKNIFKNLVLLFVNSMDESDILSFICTEAYQISIVSVESNYNYFLKKNYFFSELCGNNVKLVNIKSFFNAYVHLFIINKKNIGAKTLISNSQILYILNTFTSKILFNHPNQKSSIEKMLSETLKTYNNMN